MNKDRRKSLDRAIELLTEARELIQIAAKEEREAYDNLSESLQNAERGQAMSEAADALEAVESLLDEAVDLAQAAAQ